jgi:hypothetical protein
MGYQLRCRFWATWLRIIRIAAGVIAEAIAEGEVASVDLL